MTHLARREGTTYTARGSEMVFKATAASTDGAFSFMERELPPGGTPPLAHTHEGPEGFYVLDGEIEFTVGATTFTVTSGGFALAASGEPHTFANRSTSPARLLIIHVPAADAYFADLQELWSGAEAPSEERQRELYVKHGITPV
ncbi:MAG: cupin domain-containing protein [Actinomycetota bacterium]